MYGASGKLGRGGGGAGKRSILGPPINRARLSMGGGRGRGGASSAAVSNPSPASSLQVEESFNLVRANPLNFGMAMKLTPNLVEEIKRVEAEGGTARIKFDANAKNANGNVIQVGDKTFRFTWSRELGDLCDIYEERQSSEDGNGLLVESGATWRKLNIDRELDESTKNHVKMRSEEAERKQKSRRAIVLDHQTPSMKNQLKDLAAAESTPWRNFKNRKEPPFKKPKSIPSSAGGPPKSVYKSGFPVPSLSKSKLSSGSPLSSQLEQQGGSASPGVSGNFVKGHASLSDAVVQNKNKATGSDKEMRSRLPNSTNREELKQNRATEANPTDLRSLIISLLLKHQDKGMSLKALEKAIGDSMPNSARKIEPILKQIATFQAPGKYFLKPGVEMESFKKPPLQIGSSPEINRHESPAPQKFDQLPAQDPSFSMRTSANDEELDESNSTPMHAMGTVEKIDILGNSPEQFSDKKAVDNNGGLAGSSSDGGSESENDNDDDNDNGSDSSNSGSDSGSHSRSKSRGPVGSQNGSTSDSESDATYSSKQASDEDVDIMMSDDDKESKPKLQDSDPVSSKSPQTWCDPDDEYVDIGDYEKQDDRVSDVVDIEKDSPEDGYDAERPAASYSVRPNEEGAEPDDGINPSSSGHHEQERHYNNGKSYDGLDPVVNNGFKHGESGTVERSSKRKSKRHVEDQHSDERARNRKKLKSQSLSQPVCGAISRLFGESPSNSSPDRPLDLHDKVNLTRTTSDGSNEHNAQTCFNQLTPGGGSLYDSERSGQKSFVARPSTEAPTGKGRPDKPESLDHGVKHSERSFQSNESLYPHKVFNAETQSNDSLSRPMKFSAEAVVTESNYRKSDMLGKVKKLSSHSNSHKGNSPKDNKMSTVDRSLAMNGESGVLQRDNAELELGEYREPSNDETSGSKKQFERRNSFRHLENKQMDSGYRNSNLGRGKTSNSITADTGKLSPPNSEAAASDIPDGTSKRKALDHNADSLTRSYQKSSQTLPEHNQSRTDHIDVGSQLNIGPKISNKSRFAEAGTGQRASSDSHGDTSKSVPVTQQEPDPIQGVGPRATKENKKRKPHVARDSNDRRKKDASLTGRNGVSQKKKESSLDADSSLYTKYEKEEPELKGPIKDISQYKEYVKEYQEKYESYSSLNKILESYRDEFSKLGKDLQACKGRDMKRYNEILEQMRSSFCQCGERHKRLKKIFVVLYEELKHLKQMIKDFAASYKKD